VLVSISTTLAAFTLRHTFHLSADHLLGWFEERTRDHSQALPTALRTASDRAWKTVGLALAGDRLFDRVRDWFREGDVTALRNQIRAFVASTPTGLETAPEGVRVQACEELNRLRKSGHFSRPLDRDDLANDIRRYGDPAQVVRGAERAVAAIAEQLAPDAPHLARVLRLAPPNGTPLLVGAFLFFFRREVALKEELARELTFDSLRTVTTAQDAGFTLLDDRTVGLLDQFDILFDALENWFVAADGKLEDLRAQLDRLLDERNVPTRVVDPLRVSVTNERELAQLRHWRDELRKLPPELLAAADWSRLGDALAAGGLFGDAREAHESAAEAASAAADTAAEAEAAFKAYRDACEQEDWPEAAARLRRAADLDAARFAPFPLVRYELVGILGSGGFGTVFHCRDRYARGREVAIKALHTAELVRDLETVFEEAQTLNILSHPGIVKVFHWDFADPANRARPFLVMEHFPGVSLAEHLKRTGALLPAAFVLLAQQVAEAMSAAHAAGVLHRDLKPGNILVRPRADGPAGAVEAKVIDFGLASRMSAVQASISTPRPQRTRRDQSFAGTLEYASPEQKGKLPGAPVGPHSDVYAFGRTMQEALFGTTDPKSLHWKKLPEDVRDMLQTLLETATIEELDVRYRSFDQILEGLRGLNTREREAKEPERAIERPKRDEDERKRLEEARREAEQRAADVKRAIAQRAAEAKRAAEQRAAEAEPAAEAATRDREEWDRRVADLRRQEEERQADARRADERSGAGARRAAATPPAEETAEQLRELLIKNLTDINIRRRYLAVRTPELRARDARWNREECAGTVLIGVPVAFLFACVAGGLLGWCLGSARAGLILSALLSGTVCLLAAVAMVRNCPRVTRELGPLSEAVTDFASARKKYLGE
jgi:serine/threonine protein kinase